MKFIDLSSGSGNRRHILSEPKVIALFGWIFLIVWTAGWYFQFLAKDMGILFFGLLVGGLSLMTWCQFAYSLHTDKYREAAEASTAEIDEKVDFIQSFLSNYLDFLNIDVEKLRSQVLLDHAGTTLRASELDQAVDHEIQRRLKNRYPNILPFTRNRTKSFAVGYTRLTKVLRNLRELEPLAQRKDQLAQKVRELEANPAASPRQKEKAKDEFQNALQGLNGALYRINGEIKEIPPCGKELFMYNQKWLFLLVAGCIFFSLAANS